MRLLLLSTRAWRWESGSEHPEIRASLDRCWFLFFGRHTKIDFYAWYISTKNDRLGETGYMQARVHEVWAEGATAGAGIFRDISSLRTMHHTEPASSV